MWTRYKWSPWEIEELRLLAHRVGIATTGLDRSPLGNTKLMIAILKKLADDQSKSSA